MGSPSDGGSRPTIYDVARLAGVAPSTVSRAFARPGRVNADTAERIRLIAEEIGYRTNPLARALPTGRTSLLAIVVADVTNPFFFEILRGAEEKAAEAGYTLLVTDAQESQVAERQTLDRVIPLVEGVVLVTSRMSDSSIRVVAKQRPTIVMNRSMSDILSVTTDNARGTRRAVEHLAELGHTSITYISGPDASWTDGVRWQALREATYELGLRARRLGPFTPTHSGGRRAAHALIESPATAVLAFNDLMAIGLMAELGRHGVRVPGDVSVVGFDNIFGSDFCTPQLTTVSAPLRHLGQTAVQLLLNDLRSSRLARSTVRGPLRTAVLPTRLIVRESTAVAARGDQWQEGLAADPN